MVFFGVNSKLPAGNRQETVKTRCPLVRLGSFYARFLQLISFQTLDLKLIVILLYALTMLLEAVCRFFLFKFFPLFQFSDLMFYETRPEVSDPFHINKFKLSRV